MPLDPGLDLNELVLELLGSSGADIVFVAKEAAIEALRRSADVEGLVQNAADSSFRLDEVKVRREDFRHALGELYTNRMGKAPAPAANRKKLR